MSKERRARMKNEGNTLYTPMPLKIFKEYLRKPGSLALLYEMFLRCYRELPETTKENAFDILRFRYKTYAKTLEKGGF